MPGFRKQEDIAQAIEAAQRMARMISDILDISKMEAQQMKLAVGECNLVEVIRLSLDDPAFLVGTRQIVFEPVSQPIIVRADAEIVMRIVQNLLANALRLTPADGVVRVGIASEGDHVRIFVRDNGPGIPADLHRKIFDKYAQAIAAPSSRQRTFGLGLAFCQLAVEAHGGCIGVDSEAGEGSTFWFTLPGARHALEESSLLD